MKTIIVNEAEIPALGLGTWDLRGRTATDMVYKALEVGYSHIDTAQMYENEIEVGNGIKEADMDRDDIFLTTKVWYTHLDRQHFGPSVEESLRKLKLDYVDLVLIHWPNKDIPLEESIEELVKVRDRQLCKFIGVSNFPVELVRRTVEMGADIVTNQVEYHPFLDQSHLLDTLKELNLSLTAYCPIAQGKVIGNPVLQQIGQQYGKTEVQVTLRWLMEQEGVIAIPRTSKAERLEENLGIFDFWLSKSDLDRIGTLCKPGRRLVDPAWAPAWD